MTLSIEQIKKILADAPARALSVDADCNWYYLSESRSLSDLRTILEQHEEIERNKQRIAELEARLPKWISVNIKCQIKITTMKVVV